MFSVPDTVDKTVFVSDTIELSDESQYTCQFQLEIKKPDGTTMWTGSLGQGKDRPAKYARDEMNLGEFIGGSGNVLLGADRAKSQLISN